METTKQLSHETLQNMKKVELENSPDLIGKQMLESLKISAQNTMHLFEKHLSTYNDIFSPIDDTNLIIGVFRKYYFEIDLIKPEKRLETLVVPAAPILKATISLLRIKIMEIEAYDKENIIFYINFLGDLIELLNFKIFKEKDSKKTIATIHEDHARVINIDLLNLLCELNNTEEENTKLIDPFTQFEESEVINMDVLNKLREPNSTDEENTKLIDPLEHDIQDSIAQQNKEIKKIKSPKIHIPKIKTAQYEETEEIKVGLFTRIKRALS